MKTIALFITMLLLLCSTENIQAQEETNNETKAITAACLDYIEGWYQGDPERMAKALHPTLAKRRVVVLPQTGGHILNQLTQNDMVEYTKAGFGKQNPLKPGEEPKIEVLGVFKDVASVKITSRDFIDFAHLAKFGTEWRIMNILWEATEEK